MSFAFTDEQALLADTVARFAGDAGVSAAIRRAAETGEGFDPAVWLQIVELGLCGTIVPERFGGLGLGQIEQSIVLGALGGALLPSPLLGGVIAARAIMLAGDEAQQRRWLPGIASGAIVATVALDAPGDAPRVELIETAEGARLRGVAPLVPHGHVADLVIVAARDGDGRTRLVGVVPRQSGISAARVPYLDLTRAVAEVRFADTPVEPADILADTGGNALATLLAHANAGLAAELVRSADRALAATVDYAGQRVQFGRAIGSFQAIKHILADVAVAVEAAESAVWFAAAAADQRPAEFIEAAAVAKLLASAAAARAAAEMIQIHGGIGFTWEHDAHLHLRHARATAGLFGGAETQQAIIFAALSGEFDRAA